MKAKNLFSYIKAGIGMAAAVISLVLIRYYMYAPEQVSQLFMHLFD